MGLEEKSDRALPEPKESETFSSIKELFPYSLKIKDTYGFASYLHRDQKRLTGEPYFSHLEEVANIIVGWLSLAKGKPIPPQIEDLLVAALLHDSVEDQGLRLDTIKQCFGENVAELVEGVTLVEKSPSSENLKLIARKGKLDPLVFILKLADRLHNMRTIDYLPEEKRQQKSQETLAVYTKLAESMGMWRVKKELEDLAFRHLYPQTFKEIQEKLRLDPRLNPEFINTIQEEIRRILPNDISFQVVPRVNSLWTVWRKNQENALKGREFPGDYSKINDVLSFRVVVKSKELWVLYDLLGFLHLHFAELVDLDRFDDFVSQPKDNGYSAIQTTLNFPGKGAVEIAIVTSEKESFNDWGVISLLRKGQSIEAFKRNIVFDEKNEAWFLPEESTYLDFAYLKGIGAQASKVIVDGEEKQLIEEIRNAISVIIITYPEPRRSVPVDWLNYAHLSSTKKEIQKELNLQAYDFLVENGKRKLEEVLRNFGILDLTDLPELERQLTISSGLANYSELCFQIGNGNRSPESVKEWLCQRGTKETLNISTIRIAGLNKKGILEKLSQIVTRQGGDIRRIVSSTITQENQEFSLRLLVHGVVGKEEIIKQLIAERIKNLSEIEVV